MLPSFRGSRRRRASPRSAAVCVKREQEGAPREEEGRDEVSGDGGEVHEGEAVGRDGERCFGDVRRAERVDADDQLGRSHDGTDARGVHDGAQLPGRVRMGDERVDRDAVGDVADDRLAGDAEGCHTTVRAVPRSEQSRRAVLEAARDLVADGYERLPIKGVATRAGVSW